jgi:hypothetical protein
MTLIRVNRIAATKNERTPTRPKAIEISAMFVTSTPVLESSSTAHAPNAMGIEAKQPQAAESIERKLAETLGSLASVPGEVEWNKSATND